MGQQWTLLKGLCHKTICTPQQNAHHTNQASQDANQTSHNTNQASDNASQTSYDANQGISLDQAEAPRASWLISLLSIMLFLALHSQAL